MIQSVALHLRKLPAVYWADIESDEPLGFDVQDDVLVETEQGREVATVLRIIEKGAAVLNDFADDLEEDLEDEEQELFDKEDKEESRKPQYKDEFVSRIVRKLDDSDLLRVKEIVQKEEDAASTIKEQIKKHDLPMKFLKAEYLFDLSRLIIYFKSDNKVDFRDLLKSLASIFKTRIELRQIGVRDEAKLLGAIGGCGKIVCCKQFMNKFNPVSTKMAKEQNLSLNPVKLSGICGRLLCCLSHEYRYYASFKGKYPKIGAEVVVEDATARVVDINYITLKIILSYPDRRVVTFNLSDVKGRKDKATGRNLWWIQGPKDPEPDLGILLENLNPPGTGKKKKRRKKSK
ncbi:MAG: stage 0 sporulation protein [Candidatus Riflebacteria bacterium]|nr:stage 0 sporulation protein [Candidatus Riflebacteria bacterium]